MEMHVDHHLHLVSIWLSYDEKDVAILEPVYRQYKRKIIELLFQIRKRGFTE